MERLRQIGWIQRGVTWRRGWDVKRKLKSKTATTSLPHLQLPTHLRLSLHTHSRSPHPAPQPLPSPSAHNWFITGKVATSEGWLEGEDGVGEGGGETVVPVTRLPYSTSHNTPSPRREARGGEENVKRVSEYGSGSIRMELLEVAPPSKRKRVR